ncbi:MAG TPA: hypothetical protein PLF61_06505, partial [Candidatus Goldiibacteriota bacterium]|nr:hypothetical protein [Candidatus Goldiibacteriota bacterium]
SSYTVITKTVKNMNPGSPFYIPPSVYPGPGEYTSHSDVINLLDNNSGVFTDIDNRSNFTLYSSEISVYNFGN